MSFPSLPSVQALLRGLVSACVGSSVFAPIQQVPELAPLDTCPRPELSCHIISPANSCCSLTPAGQILQTQFWDTDPATGPANSWTIHGLWPNYCDHGFPESCDSQRLYNVRSILESYGRQDLIEYMEDYWLPDRGTTDHFWEHEWSKHGTCVSTMFPKCYGKGYKKGEEVLVYFQRTVDLFKSLDTFKALKAAGITPSKSKQYTRDEVERAIAGTSGIRATVLCDKGQLRQVFYHFNVMGTLQEGRFVRTDPVTDAGNCPKKIKYLPKP